MSRYIVTLQCDDQVGIVAQLAACLAENGVNIVSKSQYTVDASAIFCTRMVVESGNSEDFIESLREVAAGLDGELSVRPSKRHKKALVMVSSKDHCLLDLFYRKDHSELPLDIPVVVSNHDNAAKICEFYETQFEHIPVTPESKVEAEQRLEELIDEHEIDCIVLARYMQILSPQFCEKYDGRIINIHHSFLPGFKGADPYQQAWDRGVKSIGATAHFVTADLDEGPIICQEVASIDHTDSVGSLRAKGRDIERRVLATAVRAYAQDKIFLVEGKTVVF